MTAAMTLLRTDTMPIRSDSDVVLVRQQVRAWAVDLGFGIVDQTKMVTAASELARNALVHGGGGFAVLEALNDNLRKGLRITFEDRGPGIPDIELAMKDGYTTGSGLGLGLSGAKRLSNEFEIRSTAGQGTKVSITRWK
jgi:serine/threonine-protein kinase RsbT